MPEGKCVNCGEEKDYLDARGLCDGCVEEKRKEAQVEAVMLDILKRNPDLLLGGGL